jgi:hypothetical protein
MILATRSVVVLIAAVGLTGCDTRESLMNDASAALLATTGESEMIKLELGVGEVAVEEKLVCFGWFSINGGKAINYNYSANLGVGRADQRNGPWFRNQGRCGKLLSTMSADEVRRVTRD